MGRQQEQAIKSKTVETINSGTMSNYGFSIPSGGYDDEDRLTSFNRSVGLTQSWSLSLVGDWNSVTTNGIAQARTHGPSHELLTGAGQAVSTDVKGNITVIPAALRPSGVALAMTWDFDNRMATAVTGSTTVSQKYDALGRRVARTEGANTTIYAQSGQQTLCDYVAGAAPSASTYRYLFASYIDEPVVRITTSGSVATYLHRNQQYSITALTNSTGAVVERYAYTAYGVPTITNAAGTVLTSSAQNNRYLYTGREWDGAISLYHYRARMYDASLGRFCSKDPIGYVDGTNRYVYVGNMPAVFVDPRGLIKGEGEKWEVDDFFFWYYWGGGDDIDIGRIGLLKPWWDHIQPQINGNLNLNLVPYLQGQLDCMSGKTSATIDVTSGDTAPKDQKLCKGAIHTTSIGGGPGATVVEMWADPLTIMGNSCVTFRATCKLSISCVKCCNGSVEIDSSSGSCDITFSVRDKFQNPLDIGGYFGRNDWPFATPYDLYATWYHTWDWNKTYSPCEENN